MTKLKEATGGGMCGKTKFVLREEPLYIQACHCKDCQRQSGSSFVINMWIEEANVDLLSGQLQSIMLTAGSGKPVEIFSCASCGTALWSKYHASLGVDIMVRAGVLDNASEVRPDAHIYLKNKQNWLSIADDVKQFEEFYSPFKTWPEASIKRLKAMMQQVNFTKNT